MAKAEWSVACRPAMERRSEGKTIAGARARKAGDGEDGEAKGEEWFVVGESSVGRYEMKSMIGLCGVRFLLFGPVVSISGHRPCDITVT